MTGVPDTLFIQFARAPRAGQVKTRMLSALSPAQACDLHRELMCWTCEQLLATGNAVELWLDQRSEDQAVRHCLASGVSALRQQCGGDLGARMHHALSDGLARCGQVVLVGSDCPGIDGPYLGAALERLRHADIVIGPALDGGYVLLAANRIDGGLFQGIGWGGPSVYGDTLERAARLGLSWESLPALRDIDRPEDLTAWRRIRAVAASR